MTLNTARLRRHLKEFDFESLFIEELGWDNYKTNLDVDVDAGKGRFTLQAVAEKRGVVAFTCAVGAIPPYATRRKIDRQVARSFREHFIIYVDGERTEQIWQWVRREVGKPLASREHHYTIQQPGDSLIQKLQTIAFSFEEEETLTLVEVTGRVRAAFNVERATRRFYDRFKKERDVFQKFLEGIPDEELERWYVSVMLNRLMFIYFIQKKGFLDDDPDYLRHKLAQSQAQAADRFYADFLCPLFFEGFARTPDERSPQVRALLGEVPFLNGGIFQRHEVEQLHGRTIQIPDAAFERLFDFFDYYQWHLDDRPLRDDREINPDVLGYIFEKYINQKQMGAYYTKEDITGYISKNTLIPFLFDRARKKCRVAFEGKPSVWSLLAADPDRYIYEAMRKGTGRSLPPDIAAGIDDVSQHGAWNTRTPEEYALPTEIWRETVARRRRYEEVWLKLVDGEVRSINDLITYNLDIQQFAQDVIENCEGPELLRAFWRAINQVTVLDPTCGSGAFLFAALNVLEPLYEACLHRMEAFVAELAHGDHHPHKYKDFRQVLEGMQQHPNRDYFILKSIVVNNLYGVDIMAEAVEIAKLRFFLKLVAQVERVENIEPLPDIDFNIRAGNTLVGFAMREEVQKAMRNERVGDGIHQAKLLSGEDLDTLQRVEEKAADVDRLFGEFQAMQTAHDMREYAQDSMETKEVLRERLKALEEELNRYLAQEYGVDVTKRAAYQKWLASHQPFHWFVEFYGILKQGGFDVIIGNPPYVEWSKVKDKYMIQGYETEACGNLYAFMIERFMGLCKTGAMNGLIIPISILCTSRMKTLRSVLYRSSEAIWFNNYDTIPSTLFTGIVQRNTIMLTRKSTYRSAKFIHTTRLQKWYASQRPSLFALVPFTRTELPAPDRLIPKISSSMESAILLKIHAQKRPITAYRSRRSSNSLLYKRRWSYFLLFADNLKEILLPDGSVRSQQDVKLLPLQPQMNKYVFISVLSSNTFYFHFGVFSDFRHVNVSDFDIFPFDYAGLTNSGRSELGKLAKRLMLSYEENLEWRECNYTRSIGRCTVPFYRQGYSKPIMDEIDYALAQHYGFTLEELDCIINYDIKYRMGDALFEGVGNNDD